MSRVLKYQDLNPAEQLQYKKILSDETSLKAQTSTLSRRRNLWASVKSVYSYGKSLLDRHSLAPGEKKAWTELEQFIRTQASNRGCETFDRESFPNFPDGIEPFIQGYPDALHDIIETFRDASPAQRLEMLMAYAETLPELPEELHRARDTMEKVDECQIPVFLLAQLRDGKVHYYIDVPPDAPTMRGFAGILHAGLNGATPAAIAATPNDLCQQLGLHKSLAPLRLRGLTALLRRMQHNARELANTA
jgi:cysteine desulfuration protein SufE